jgi:DNA-binding transcriptional LysR family regulator
LVLFPRQLGPAFYDRFIGSCGDAGFSPRIVQEATQWQSIVAIVEAGAGVSLCWKKGKTNPTMQAFVTLARAGFGQQ